HLELLQLGLDRRLLDIGLGGLDHLDPPGIPDEAIRERDAKRPTLVVELIILGFFSPRLEALGIGAGPRHDARPFGERGRTEAEHPPEPPEDDDRRERETPDHRPDWTTDTKAIHCDLLSVISGRRKWTRRIVGLRIH